MSTNLRDSAHYERDFYRWTQRQAAELRRAAGQGSNLPLDWDHLAEEIESLGTRDRRELYSRLVRTIEHLLKLQYAPADAPRRLWTVSVLNQRSDLKAILKDSPSLRRVARERLDQAHEEARDLVERTVPDAELGQWPDLPRTCPYTLEQVLGPEFWPEPMAR